MSAKLYYFNARGIAEPIRFILAYGGVEYEDIRSPLDGFPPTLPSEIKDKCTWGQVPVIEFEGKKLAQSLAITRYFAKKFKLVPQDDFQAALCDEYVDATRDYFMSWVPILKEEDAAKKEQLKQEMLITSKKKFIDVFESIVKANDGKHLVGKSLTWADIYLAHLMNNFEILLKVDVAKESPSLTALKKEVLSTPAIKEWIEKRPDSVF